MSKSPQSKPNASAPRRGRGFNAVSGLVERQVRRSGEKRGFAVMRLLTHWTEIVGEDTAKFATPVKISYARDGFGATLTVLTSGAQAPMLQAQLPQIQAKVNACYGYHAISRVRITQTAPTGFHEGQLAFDGPPPAKPKVATPEVKAASRETVSAVSDDGLKAALERLGENVLSKTRSP